MKRSAGADAVRVKGWLVAHRWLITRRAAQFALLALFLAGPWLGYWIVKGNLNYSLIFGVLPLADPYVLLQSIAAGHKPAAKALIGATVILIAYSLAGGRVYCAWVCPINILSDATNWLRARFGVRASVRLSRSTRYWILAMTLVLALMTGTIAWELVNPVSMLYRGVLFGIGAGWTVIGGLFLLDLFAAERAWCAHLCPSGAFYSAISRFSVLRIVAVRREQCNDCADCYAVCPEPLIIKPALKGMENGIGPVIQSSHCTNCGRCIDVCSRHVFAFGFRFSNRGSGRPATFSGRPGNTDTLEAS